MNFSELGHPMGLFWFMLSGLTVFYLVRREVRNAVIAGGMAVLVWGGGNYRIAQALLARLERPYIPVREGGFEVRFPRADAVVVLGGGHVPSRYDYFGVELRNAGDRLLLGMELVRRGRAETLVVPGFKYREIGHNDHRLNKLLEVWQIDPGVVVSMGVCGDTHDEAVRTRRIAQNRSWERVYLVTSAYHMHRALATFRKQGIPVEPAVCDFLVLGNAGYVPEWRIVPEYDAFSLLQLYLHELVGYSVYRLRGWL